MSWVCWRLEELVLDWQDQDQGEDVIAQISLAVVMGRGGAGGETVTGRLHSPLPGFYSSVRDRQPTRSDCDAVRSTQCQAKRVKFYL